MWLAFADRIPPLCIFSIVEPSILMYNCINVSRGLGSAAKNEKIMEEE